MTAHRIYAVKPKAEPMNYLVSSASSNNLGKNKPFEPAPVSAAPFAREQSRGEAYLSFQLTDRFSGAFSMNDVHEVAVISSGQITPVFNLPACVLGLLTRRSRILWTVDLSQWLCAQPVVAARSSQQLSVAIVSVSSSLSAEAATPSLTDKALLGLVVQRVNGYIQIHPDFIQPPDEIQMGDRTSEQLSCLAGSLSNESFLDKNFLEAGIPTESNSSPNSSLEKRLHILDANAIARALLKTVTHPAAC